jgi:hypothetical protein
VQRRTIGAVNYGRRQGAVDSLVVVAGQGNLPETSISPGSCLPYTVHGFKEKAGQDAGCDHPSTDPEPPRPSPSGW